ncbi:hypothetical protein HHO41_14850 [Bacillus sp. DNRA2]|uniref:T7SS effector LXG polymorphic toxin n=1 Tax=Bacillus sp. DNRA2 TaxID=2723053 RepID=UPI00145EE32E|nr:hypothetical protein [Bacillus sp. DNRA2]
MNDEINELVDNLKSYKEDLSKEVYGQYKASVVLSKTINLRGKTGDAFKNYISVVHLQLAQKIINIIGEIDKAANQMKKDFESYEKDDKGIVGSGTLTEVKETIQQSKSSFEKLDSKSDSLLCKASEFIATTKLPGNSVSDDYDAVTKNITKTKELLEETDAKVAKDLTQLVTRVNELKKQINTLYSKFRDDNGIKYSKVNNIKNNKWYTDEKKGLFGKMYKDDPFTYKAGSKALYEEQWVKGTSDEKYESTTVSAFQASGFTKKDEGNLELSGEAYTFSIDGHSQFNKYLKSDDSLHLLGGQGKTVLGKDGVELEGKLLVYGQEHSGVLGNDNFDGHINGQLEALSLDGNLAVILPDEKGDFKLALGGNIVGANAELGVGTKLFGIEELTVPVKDSSGKIVEKSLLSLEVGGGIGPQIGAGVEFSSETVIEKDFFYVKSNTLLIDLGAGFKGNIDISVPTAGLKFPW